VLQRIHHLDLNRDGYADLLFCNAQVHLEAPPACVYRDVFGAPASVPRCRPSASCHSS
jgi:hypothetical protein